MKKRHDIIVIGGGHAGIEAAWAAASLGADVALITMSWESVGRMSCNPAIGGLGKGQIVREIDALGGLMGLATDRAGIQFRMLNRSKGPAVWAPRAQADRDLYPLAVQELLSTARSLDIVEGTVEEIIATPHLDSEKSTDESAVSTSRRIKGVLLTDGRELLAECVIVTTGTFLAGLMHCGLEQTEGGRVGEPGAKGLSKCFESLGIELGRLKTGTPPRIHRDTIDYDVCDAQPGDEYPTPFSALTGAILQPQVQCHVTWTNNDVHDLIRSNLHRAPMYSGQIQSNGPRYCPSIEDKVVRFADKSKHQVFLEPEGYENERVYCNGVSTSLPEDVQTAFIREVKGLENARILQHGYAVEYDYVPTHQTKLSLESKLVGGLFLAGQINGTSGYEEAAGQGLVAGVNAARLLGNQKPLILGRDEAYIGVMIDDLITRPPTEPYRMFTSRAEYRLLLRADNADERLTPLGRSLGLVQDDRWRVFENRRKATLAVTELCSATGIRASLSRPETSVKDVAEVISRGSNRTFCIDAIENVLTAAKYAGYIKRQAKQIERFRKLESFLIPNKLDYHSMANLRLEARERLGAVSPKTLGQASRISGINPADITVLWVHIASLKKQKQSPQHMSPEVLSSPK